MMLTRKKKLALISATAVFFLAGLLLAANFLRNSDRSAREHILQFVPADATGVIYVDFDQLRASPFLAELYAWAPPSSEDREYAQFVHDTGFSYQRDLQRVAVSISHHGASTNIFAVADGKFDRKKIEAFFSRNGKSTQPTQPTLQGTGNVFRLNATANEKPLLFTFLSNDRVAIANYEDFPAALPAAPTDSYQVEWNSRFARLAGSPVFAVIRQDPEIENVLNSVAPGSFQSPQLSALLAQLRWISIAAKPDGDQLRVVADGESVEPSVTSQLNEFLQGVLLLAQNGLNDPKLRQTMNPEARQAYLELLKSADVQKIDRGEWKSVRVLLEITPKFLDIARRASTSTPADQTSAAPKDPQQGGATTKSKIPKRK
jgi:hypothetical protein